MTHIIQNNILKAQFSNNGAELISLKYYDNELIWSAQEPWKRHAPILFPIVGKLKDDFYYYQNQKYFLPQHGFARDKEWLCTYQNDNTIEFELTDDTDTFKYYPFHFSVIVRYQIIDTSLYIHFCVFNPYHYPLPFSIGYHPAFYLPDSLNNYTLSFFPSQKEIKRTLLTNGLLSHQKQIITLQNSQLTLHSNLFSNDAIVIENTDISKISMQFKNFILNLHTGNAKNLGIWTKPNCNNFICLEPWMGIADVENHNHIIEQKKDIILLPAYQRWEWEIIMNIQKTT